MDQLPEHLSPKSGFLKLHQIADRAQQKQSRQRVPRVVALLLLFALLVLGIFTLTPAKRLSREIYEKSVVVLKDWNPFKSSTSQTANLTPQPYQKTPIVLPDGSLVMLRANQIILNSKGKETVLVNGISDSAWKLSVNPESDKIAWVQINGSVDVLYIWDTKTALLETVSDSQPILAYAWSKDSTSVVLMSDQLRVYSVLQDDSVPVPPVSPETRSVLLVGFTESNEILSLASDCMSTETQKPACFHYVRSKLNQEGWNSSFIYNLPANRMVERVFEHAVDQYFLVAKNAVGGDELYFDRLDIAQSSSVDWMRATDYPDEFSFLEYAASDAKIFGLYQNREPVMIDLKVAKISNLAKDKSFINIKAFDGMEEGSFSPIGYDSKSQLLYYRASFTSEPGILKLFVLDVGANSVKLISADVQDAVLVHQSSQDEAFSLSSLLEKPIDVATPVRLDSITSPLTISGSAKVPQNPITVRIKDGNGQVLGEGSAEVTVDLREPFGVVVEFSKSTTERGLVEVFYGDPSVENKPGYMGIPIAFKELL